jgi:hypothetical protein
MLTDMKESDLQSASTEEIVTMVNNHVNHFYFTEQQIEEGAKVVDGIRRLAPGVRGVVLSYLCSGELLCAECGETSCVHGYSDD